MPNYGLLLTMTEPPPDMEEEFNAWYDDEHMAERLAIPGFRSARRWVAGCKPGEGRYLATYELDSPAVLQSGEYLKRFENQTPWSKRCLAKCVLFRRWACEQVSPGNAETHPAARAVLLVCSRTPDADLVHGNALQVRRFKASSGEPQHVALVDFASAEETILVKNPGAFSRLYRAYG